MTLIDNCLEKKRGNERRKASSLLRSDEKKQLKRVYDDHEAEQKLQTQRGIAPAEAPRSFVSPTPRHHDETSQDGESHYTGLSVDDTELDSIRGT